MSDTPETDPGQLVRYPLTWPKGMAKKVAAAAKSQTMPMSVWIREAIKEKLEREGQ